MKMQSTRSVLAAKEERHMSRIWDMGYFNFSPPHVAEYYPPPAHNANWRFEMGRIARTANVSNEAQSDRAKPYPLPPISCETVRL